MKKVFVMIAVLGITAPALAQSEHYVRGYERSNGTYVAGHEQTNSNSTKLDNWSTQGNTNPYTGQAGTVNPYATTQANPYGSPTNTGHRGW